MLIIVNGSVDTADKRRFVEGIRRRVASESDILFIQGQQFELLPILKYGFICLRPTKTDGDSLTVREALAMNCHVVASDKAVRTDGVVTYHDENDLYTKVSELIINNKRSDLPASAKLDFYTLITNVYESL